MDTISSFFRAANARLSDLGSALMQGSGEGLQIWHTLSTFMASGEGIVTLAYALIVAMIEPAQSGFTGPMRRLHAARLMRRIVPSRALAAVLALRRTALFLSGFLLFSTATLGSVAFFEWAGGCRTPGACPHHAHPVTRLMWIIADSLFAPAILSADC